MSRARRTRLGTATAAGVLLALALSTASCGSSSGPDRTVRGSVELGPFCPVVQPGSGCPAPPGAFDGAFAVATNGTDEIRQPLTADGTFELTLSPGTWRLTATAGMRCDTVEIPGSTSAASSTAVVVQCDTGIR